MTRQMLSTMLASASAVALLLGAQAARADDLKLTALMEDVPETHIIEALLPEFTKETGITVEFQKLAYPDMHQKLVTQLISNKSAYNVLEVDFLWAGEFPEAGWLADLQPFVDKTSFDLKPFIPSMMDLVGKHKDAVAYALAVIVADKETPCSIRVTSITSVKIFLNQKELFGRDEYHHGAPFDANVTRGTLKAGENVIVLKVWFSRRLRAAGEEAGSTALGVEAMHHWSDAVTSGAAFIGIAIALAGGRGWEAADDWAALFACVVIAFNGISMIGRALGDVMDTAVPQRFENEIRGIALAVPGVLALDKVRVRKSGLSHLVDIQVRVDGELTVRAGHDIAHAVKDALIASAAHRVSDVTVHVEPMK